MAISWAIAARRGQAVDRLKANIQAISEKYGIEPMGDVQRPRRGQDPLISQMLEAEMFAEWTDRLAEASGLTPQVPASNGEPESSAETPAAPCLPGGEGDQKPSDPETMKPNPLPPYFDMSEADLGALAADRGIDIPEDAAREQIVAALTAEDDHKMADDFEDMTIADLRAYADAHRINLGTAKLKAEIVAAIRAAEAKA